MPVNRQIDTAQSTELDLAGPVDLLDSGKLDQRRADTFRYGLTPNQEL
jgi:hypothetical protein